MKKLDAKTLATILKEHSPIWFPCGEDDLHNVGIDDQIDLYGIVEDINKVCEGRE